MYILLNATNSTVQTMSNNYYTWKSALLKLMWNQKK